MSSEPTNWRDAALELANGARWRRRVRLKIAVKIMDWRLSAAVLDEEARARRALRRALKL